MKLGPIALCLGLLVAVSTFFHFFPALDIIATRIFYAPGEGFPLGDVWALQALRIFSDMLMWTIVLICVVALALHFSKTEWTRILPANIALFLLSTLAVGPGLIVNGVLKEYWGRPRPINVDHFGGEFPYVEAWRISAYCESNCSFVSGEASSAIWFVGLSLLAPAAWRLSVAIPLVLFALVLSINRIAFGGHFLSDVVISWLLTLIVMAIFYRLLVAARGERPQ